MKQVEQSQINIQIKKLPSQKQTIQQQQNGCIQCQLTPCYCCCTWNAQKCCIGTYILFKILFALAQITATVLDWYFMVNFFLRKQFENDGKYNSILVNHVLMYIFLGLLAVRLVILMMTCVAFSYKTFQKDICQKIFCWCTCIHPLFLMLGTYFKLFDLCLQQTAISDLDTFICFLLQDIPTIALMSFFKYYGMQWDTYDYVTVIAASISALLSLPLICKLCK